MKLENVRWRIAPERDHFALFGSYCRLVSKDMVDANVESSQSKLELGVKTHHLQVKTCEYELHGELEE